MKIEELKNKICEKVSRQVVDYPSALMYNFMSTVRQFLEEDLKLDNDWYYKTNYETGRSEIRYHITQKRNSVWVDLRFGHCQASVGLCRLDLKYKQVKEDSEHWYKRYQFKNIEAFSYFDSYEEAIEQLRKRSASELENKNSTDKVLNEIEPLIKGIIEDKAGKITDTYPVKYVYEDFKEQLRKLIENIDKKEH